MLSGYLVAKVFYTMADDRSLFFLDHSTQHAHTTDVMHHVLTFLSLTYPSTTQGQRAGPLLEHDVYHTHPPSLSYLVCRSHR